MAQKTIIWPFFFVALLFALIPWLPITAFAPFLALTYSHRCQITSLWIGAGCGLILDLLSNAPFGIYTLNYISITLILFRYRIYFVEKPIGLAILTLIFSILTSLASKILFLLYEISLPMHFKGLCTDFFLMPLLDGIYSLLCFSFPWTLYRFSRRLWFRFLFLRKEIKKKKDKEPNPHAKRT